MFVYIAVSLGSFNSGWSIRSIVTSSKFSLGIAGILLVLSSVSISFGIMSAMGIKTTLIIAEVIPFLVLAIGVDNMFILVNSLERINLKSIQNKIESGSEHVPEDTDYILTPEEVEKNCAATLAEIGPSILLSGLSEIVAFGLGSIVDMPAVAVFSMYASVAVLVGSLLQVTVFVSFMCLDGKRKAVKFS
jgi:Niemann-Pick C1 protein